MITLTRPRPYRFLGEEDAGEELVENPEEPASQNIFLARGTYRVSMSGAGSVVAAGVGGGVAISSTPAIFVALRGVLTLTVVGVVTAMSCKRLL